MSGGDDLSGFSLLELFRAEAESHLGVLENGIVALEADPREPKRLEDLMRAAHSIKGAARIVGLDAAVTVAHGMEDVFVAAQKGKVVLGPGAVDALLAGTDLLKAMSRLDPAGAPAALASRADEIAALVAQLAAAARGEVLEVRRAASAPAAAVAAPTSATDAPPPAATASAPATPTPTASAAAPAAAAPGSAGDDAAVRVSATSLTRMLAYAGETLVEARRLAGQAHALEPLRRQSRELAEDLERLAGATSASLALRLGLERLRERIGQQGEALEITARRTEDLAERLYGEVLASRMRPFGDVLGGFPRLVRDVAKELGKRVHFEIQGRDVLVDRDLMDRIEAPLNHLLRNALDHGLEMPAEREAQGKAPEGALSLTARHRGGMLEVSVADDGRGVDPERVRARVVERGLIAADIARSLSRTELLEFLFLPSFTTRDDVTQLSGRGVGLDVVHRFAQDMGGGARIESEPGRGARFVLVLPITRSVLRAALVEIGGEPFAFPLTRIERLLRLDPADLHAAEGRQHYLHEGAPVGVVSAAEVLGMPGGRAPDSGVPVVQLASGEDRYGLAVERFLGEQDLVVRPLDPRLGKVPNLSSAAVLENGDPVLIVDTDDLMRSVDQQLHQGRMRTIRVTRREEASRRSRKRVLVVDDSRTVREVERGLLASRGYLVDVAVDGSDGWNSVRAGEYDLVITDVDMPRMNGIELVQRIKQDAQLRKIPVMIVSYKDSEEDRQRGLDAGADAYVAKSSFQEAGWISAVVELVGEP